MNRKRMKEWPSVFLHIAVAVTLLVALGGCASYRPLPLAEQATLPAHYTDIKVDRDELPLPELAAHPFNQGGSLDIDDIATLAVVNNPDLKSARADVRIAQAQAFNAGLLPDPQLTFTHDFVTNPPPGATSAYSLNIAEDIAALIRHHFESQAGKLDAKKTDLNLLWQEWQVIAKARISFVKLVEERRLMRVLSDNRVLFADRYTRTRTALERGLMTLDAVTPYLTALQDLDKQLRDLERQTSADQHDLNALLGLAPEALLPLRDDITLPALDEEQVMALLPELPRRRADLIALHYGYQAEDRRLRAAIAGQFPTFNLGFTHARDTSDVHTNGFGIVLSLPIFNGNRGNIAIEEATRQKLYDDYQARLNAAVGDVHRILAEQRINARQLHDVDAGLVELEHASEQAERAFHAHAIDALAYASLEASLLSKQVEKIGLEQSMLQQRIALQALLGGALPVKPE
jgi:outer membrane protein TolC